MTKCKVVARAFYEDAYLNFFIKWYLDLGFDQIDILKADYDIFGDSNITKHNKVRIIPVENTGNQILLDHYDVFRDLDFDWVLNIDADEFLVIDRVKYPKGVTDLIVDLEKWTIANNIPADNLQMIVFNWVCVDKQNIIPGTGENGSITMADMVNKHPLHAFSYIKSLAKIKHLTDTKPIEPNCHNMITKPIHTSNGNGHYHITGDQIIHIITHTYNINQNSFKWGFLLHLNTRSLANALTKSLVTQLRRRKQIVDIKQFAELVNHFDAELILEDTDYKNKIMIQFQHQLNLKWRFPIKIRNYHETVKQIVNIDNLHTLIKTTNPSLMSIPICHHEVEMNILRDLCTKANVDWDKCHQILSLFT